MTDTKTAEKLFFDKTGMDRRRVQTIVGDSLKGCDDGELFLEYTQSESVTFDDGRIKSASFDTGQGFGLRAVSGETTGYAHANTLTEDAITRAGKTVSAVRAGRGGTAAEAPTTTNSRLYTDENPLPLVPFEIKVETLAAIDAYARKKDPRVKQVSASLGGSWQAVHIVRADGKAVSDIRPLVRLNVSIVVTDGKRMETGSYGSGGRVTYGEFLKPESWKASVDEALRQALVNLESVDAPGGEMTVVLGPGWPGVLLHEAVGHGLEGDFNRKKTSAFSEMMGKRVAAKGVTVIDDGTFADRRGSLSVDDEGTPTSRTVLIEDGILRGYLQDRMNARLMKMKPTGNGRRQSHAHHPMPRMTNTFMLPGTSAPDEIVRSVRRGLYAVHFGGGQVDITCGKFVFSASEAYLIEDGCITAPVRGATLIGNGPDVLTRVRQVGDDLELDEGIGTCGKDGQSVPVGVGMPTLLVDEITVGGTRS
ncbi:MAG: metalloprotease TldD [Alphaproteobacteria bacterium]|nr:metalloprotease TldD [Alphaproteobacteria bacterium]